MLSILTCTMYIYMYMYMYMYMYLMGYCHIIPLPPQDYLGKI